MAACLDVAQPEFTPVNRLRHAADGTQPRTAAPGGESLWRTLACEHFWLLICSAVYVLGCWWIVAATPAANFDTANNFLVWPGFAGTLLLGLVIGLCFNVLVLQHPSRPLRFIAGEVAALCKPRQLLGGLLVLFLSAPVIFYFSQLKSLIPYLNPAGWDSVFSHADYLLFFGHYPHTYLSFLIGGPGRYQVLSFVYEAVWTSVCIGVLAYAAFVARPGFRRSRFLLGYFLCWMLIGTICGIAFNSGGPVFFDIYTGGGQMYAALLAQLQHLSDNSNKLFDAYALMQELQSFRAVDIAPPAGMGISAMPSMHVSMAFIAYLYARGAGAWPRALALGHCIVIYLASIAFGWHYAVDGLVSVALTVAVWRLAAWLVRMQTVVVPGVQPLAGRSKPCPLPLSAEGLPVQNAG